MRFAPDGSFSNTIVRVPGFESFTREYRGAVSTGRRPMGHWLWGTVSPDRIYYGEGERYDLVAYDPDGKVVMFVRRAERDRSLRQDDIEAYKAEIMEGAPADPERRRDWQRMVDEAPYPSSLPAYQRLIVDVESNLWVQEYERPGADTVVWSVFDDEGRWLTEVSIPRDLRIYEVGADYALTLWTDELDVEFVRMYPLAKGG
jgi:hypothetical protein